MDYIYPLPFVLGWLLALSFYLDRRQPRALVFTASLWGKSGHTETYGPSALRRMWVKKSFWVKGAGDLVFKTETTHHTRTERDHTTGRTRTSTSTSTQYFGFLGVEGVKDVETLVHEVLLARKRDDDDD